MQTIKASVSATTPKAAKVESPTEPKKVQKFSQTAAYVKKMKFIHDEQFNIREKNKFLISVLAIYLERDSRYQNICGAIFDKDSGTLLFEGIKVPIKIVTNDWVVADETCTIIKDKVKLNDCKFAPYFEGIPIRLFKTDNIYFATRRNIKEYSTTSPVKLLKKPAEESEERADDEDYITGLMNKFNSLCKFNVEQLFQENSALCYNFLLCDNEYTMTSHRDMGTGKLIYMSYNMMGVNTNIAQPTASNIPEVLNEYKIAETFDPVEAKEIFLGGLERKFGALSGEPVAMQYKGVDYWIIPTNYNHKMSYHIKGNMLLCAADALDNKPRVYLKPNDTLRDEQFKRVGYLYYFETDPENEHVIFSQSTNFVLSASRFKQVAAVEAIRQMREGREKIISCLHDFYCKGLKRVDLQSNSKRIYKTEKFINSVLSQVRKQGQIDNDEALKAIETLVNQRKYSELYYTVRWLSK